MTVALPLKKPRILGVEWANPITEGLVVAAPLQAPGAVGRNLVYPELVVGSGPGPGGVAGSVTADADAYRNSFGSGYTIMVWHSGMVFDSWTSAGGVTDDVIGWNRYSTSSYFKIYHNGTGGTWSDLYISDFQSPAVNAMVWRDYTLYAYRDGSSLSSKSMAVAPNTSSTTGYFYTGGNANAVYQVLAWSRGLSADEIARLTTYPFDLYRVAGPVIIAAIDISGGTAHELVGAVAGTSGLSAALATVRSLTGNLAGSSSVTAALTVTRSLASSATATSQTLADLGIARSLTGQGETQSNVTASLGTVRSLTGNITAASNVTGALTIQGQVTLAGTVTANAAVSASLRAAKPLTGSLAASGGTSAALAATRPLAGPVTGRANVTGTMTVVRTLCGSVTAFVEPVGTVRITRPMTGVVAGTTDVGGRLLLDTDHQVDLAGAIGVLTTLVATLRIFRSPTGQAAVLESMMLADAEAILDDLPAESAVYQPITGDARAIEIVVDRQAPRLVDTPRRKQQPMRIWARNDDRAGIANTELTTRDTVLIARHVGSTPVAMRIVRRLGQSGGWTQLEVL